MRHLIINALIINKIITIIIAVKCIRELRIPEACNSCMKMLITCEILVAMIIVIAKTFN